MNYEILLYIMFFVTFVFLILMFFNFRNLAKRKKDAKLRASYSADFVENIKDDYLKIEHDMVLKALDSETDSVKGYKYE